MESPESSMSFRLPPPKCCRTAVAGFCFSKNSILIARIFFFFYFFFSNIFFFYIFIYYENKITQNNSLAVRQHFVGGYENSIFWYTKYHYGSLKDILLTYSFGLWSGSDLRTEIMFEAYSLNWYFFQPSLNLAFSTGDNLFSSIDTPLPPSPVIRDT